MVKRTAKGDDKEPGQGSFDLPSANKEHLFQVVDVLDDFNGDPDIFFAKCEVVGGDEEGRSLLHRCTLDDSQKQFFFTRMFLKAVGEPYKGEMIPIDTERWVGRQFYAIVSHSKDGKYANINEFMFEKQVEQYDKDDKNDNGNGNSPDSTSDEIAWDD